MAERPRELGDFKKARVNGGIVSPAVYPRFLEIAELTITLRLVHIHVNCGSAVPTTSVTPLIRTTSRSRQQKSSGALGATQAKGSVARGSGGRSTYSCRHRAEDETCSRVARHHSGSTGCLTQAVRCRTCLVDWDKTAQYQNDHQNRQS